MVIDVLQQCGFWLGIEKCQLVPTLSMELLGFIISSLDLSIKLPQRKIDSIAKLSQDIMHNKTCSLEEIRSFCGKIIAVDKTFWACRVYLRELFRILKKYAEVEPQQAPQTRLVLQQDQIWEILFWSENIQKAGMPLVFSSTVIPFYSDASGFGWGGHWANFSVSGLFREAEAEKSSTYREILALKLVFLRLKNELLRHFQTPYKGSVTHLSILQPTVDNYGVKQILKWGSRVRGLNEVVKFLWNMAWECGFVWRPLWIPRELNTRADELSKLETFSIILNPEAFALCYYNKRILPTCQAFSEREGIIPAVRNCYWHMADPEALHIDFLSHKWDSSCLPLATPAWRDLDKVLAHVRDTACKAIVVCPIWSGASWWPLLQSMKIWGWVSPSHVPMFKLLGSGIPSFQPQKLRFPSGFFYIDGNLATTQVTRKSLQRFQCCKKPQHPDAYLHPHPPP